MRSVLGIFRKRNNCIASFSLLFLCYCSALKAQSNVWLFGSTAANCAGLKFTPTPQQNTIANACKFYECSSVVSDNAGNILFYTNGVAVYNKNNAKMPNGDNLLGSQENNAVLNSAGSSPNGVISVSDPANPNRYYIFTINDLINNTRNGFRYSIVDMTLDGGLGDVVLASKNTIILDGTATPTAEMMAVVAVPCSDTVWIVVHGAGNNDFYSYPLSSAGLGAQVTTSVGYSMSGGGNDNRGSMAFSPDGSHLLLTGMVNCGLWLYNFQSSGINAGKLTPWNIGKNGTNQVITTGIYSAEWSPDGQKIYMTSNGTLKYFNTNVAYNAATNPVAITITENIGSMRRGPDGILYAGKTGAGNYLSTLSDPDAATVGAASASWLDHGFDAGSSVSWALPSSVIVNSSNQALITNPLNDTTVCSNVAPFQLTATPGGGTWSSVPSGFVNGAGMFDPGAGVGSAPWTVKIYYDNIPCVNPDSVTITVNNCSCPDTTLSPSIPPICPEDAINLDTYKITAEAGTWTIESGPSGVASITGGTTFNGNNTAPGNYVVRFTLTTVVPNCPLFSERTVVVKPTPPVSVADHTQCFGEPAWTFDAGAGFDTYAWTGPLSGNAQTLATSLEGKYTVTVTLNGCTGSDTAHLTITPLPVVSFVLADPDACINESAFALSGGSPAGGTYSGLGVSAGNFDPANSGGAGVKQLTYTVTASGCTDSAHASLTVHDLPLVTLDIPTATICEDASAFALSGGNPGGGSFSGPGVNAGMFDPATAGAGKDTITYTYQDAFSCSNTATDTIKVNALPLVNLVLSPNTVCADATPFALSGGTPLGGTYSGTGVSLNNFDPSSGTNPTIITYTYTDPLTTCTNSEQDQIIVNALPQMSLADTSACPGGSGIILIPSPSFWNAYDWSTTETSSTITVNTVNTKYWVTVTDANGCKTTDTAFVAMGDTLHVDFGADKEICTAQTLTLDAAKFGPFQNLVKYEWNGVVGNSTLAVTQSSLYGVLVTDGRGCIGSDSINVVVNPLPSVDLGNDTLICFTGKQNYVAILPNNYSSILWSNGKTGLKGTSTSPGNFWVTVTNQYTCSAADTVNLTEFCEDIVLCFPNVITVNNDGLNDHFKPCADNYQSIDDGNYQFYINNITFIDFQMYDRWGVRVFQSKNVLPEWDGTYNGSPASAGVYYWLVRYKDSAKKDYEVSGWVQLIR